jgi:hypothetical protein
MRRKDGRYGPGAKIEDPGKEREDDEDKPLHREQRGDVNESLFGLEQGNLDRQPLMRPSVRHWATTHPARGHFPRLIHAHLPALPAELLDKRPPRESEKSPNDEDADGRIDEDVEEVERARVRRCWERKKSDGSTSDRWIRRRGGGEAGRGEGGNENARGELIKIGVSGE